MGSILNNAVLLLALGSWAAAWAEPPGSCPPGTLQGVRAGFATDTTSADGLHFNAHTGTPSPALPDWGLREGTDVRRLSDNQRNRSRSGNFGQVYLVRPPGEPPYALKAYWDAEEMQTDLESLAFIQRRTQDHPSRPRFRVATAVAGPNPETMKLEYARGRELAGLLNDPAVPKALKERLFRSYVDRLTQFARDMQSDVRVNHHLDYKWGDWLGVNLSVKPQELDHSITLNITPAQIIVDPETLEMTIIDPR